MEPEGSQAKLEARCQERQRQQLRRRAIMMLSLIAEPLKLQWDEAFLDVAWSAWREVLDTRDETGRLGRVPADVAGGDRCRRSLSRGQANGGEPMQAALRTKFEEHGIRVLSLGQLAVLLQRLAPELAPGDAELLASLVPQEPAGFISVDRLLSWIFDWPHQQAGQTNGTERLHTVMCRTSADINRRQALRRRAIMALALISEPEEGEWNEVFMDCAWWAWTEATAAARFERLHA